MSELTRIVIGLSIALTIIYFFVIRLTLLQGKSISFYLVCIIVNLAVALWFWYISTRPTNDPQDGMGLGPIMIICGLITVVIPIVALIVFLIRRYLV